MPDFCVVIGCGSNRARDNVSFYRVPSVFDNKGRFDPERAARRDAWRAAFQRKNITESILKYERVCSKHFISGKPAELKDKDNPDWVPSINMGCSGGAYGNGGFKYNSKDAAWMEAKVQNLPKPTIRAGRCCCVPHCDSTCTQEISLHRFPLNSQKLCKQWKRILKISRPITKYMCVCSKHFLLKDFTISSPARKLRRLKKWVIPSQNIPRNKQRNISNVSGIYQKWLTEFKEDSEGTNTTHLVINFNLANSHVSDATKPSSRCVNKLKRCKPCNEKAVQTDFCDLLELTQVTNDKLLTLTGLDSKLMDAVHKYVHMIDPIDNLQMRLFLVMCKLKLNTSFANLASLLNISEAACSDFFYSTVPLLGSALKHSIYWPSKNEILKNIPKCYHNYKHTRVVLDFVDIKVDSSDSQLQNQNCDKIKYMIGIAPGGFVSYISPTYDGKTLDSVIVKKEKLLEKLEPGDAIMGDRSVFEKPCAVNFFPLICSLKHTDNVTESDIVNIAKARALVERIIGRMRTFYILNHPIERNLLPYIDHIIVIVAVTAINLPQALSSDSLK